MKNYILLYALIFISFIFNTGCGEDLKPAEAAATFSSTLPGNGNDNEDNTQPALDNANIYVKLKNSNYLSYTNSSGIWNDECNISKSTGGNTDLDCLIDVQELDLYMNSLTLEYNFPQGMCDYVTTEVPWHWNYSSGHGPLEVTVSIDTSGTSPVSGTTDPTSTGCTAKLHDGSEVACSAAPEIKGLSEQFAPSCIYDYTGEEDGKPNCCFGSYNLITHTDENGDGTVDKITEANVKWGGEVKNCIGGHGKTDWNKFTVKGYPISRIEASTTGISNTLVVTSNASSNVSYFSYPATYYETAGTPHNHDGYVSVATSDAPYAVEPIDDLDGTPITSGNPAYRITCKDTSGENLQRVDVHIREWNTYADFINFGNSNGATVNSDVVGVEGTDCDYDSIFNSSSCNDRWDFKDILSRAGGSYTTDNTVPSPNTIRRSYFPEVLYK